MTHPDTEVRWVDDGIGYGLFAKTSIPRGTLTWVRDSLDRVFSPADLESMDLPTRETVLHFSYRDRAGHYVFCWDNTRYVNHSFTPNCLLTPCGFEIAVEDIVEGQQLTMDYGCLNILESFDPVEGCATSGRTRVEPDDLLCHAEGWDQKILLASQDFAQVRQPLLPWLPDRTVDLMNGVALGVDTLPSVSTMCCVD